MAALDNLDRKILYFLKSIGLLARVPGCPAPGKVLARSACFLHGGDNPNALLLFVDGYACETGQCHKNKTFGLNLPGLVRHMVYKVTGEVMDWRPAWRFAQDNAARLEELVGETVRHAKAATDRRRHVDYSAADLAACLEIPDPFYLTRGFQAETLVHFGVGRCVRPLPDGNDLVGWSVVPVPGHGYTARNPRWFETARAPKWHHAVARNDCLFKAPWKEGRSNRPVIVCEGPGEVMRFWEAGLGNAVAVLGNSVSDVQRLLLTGCTRYGEETVYIAADTDEGGQKFAEQASHKLSCFYKPVVIFPARTKDFGAATVDEIRALDLMPAASVRATR